MAALHELITKPIRADHAPRLNGHTPAESDVVIQHDVRMKNRLVADPAAGTDAHARVNVAILADDHILGDVRSGMDVRVLANMGRGMHRRVRGDAHRQPFSPRVKRFQNLQKRLPGIRHDQHSLRNVLQIEGLRQGASHKNGGGLAGFEIPRRASSLTKVISPFAGFFQSLSARDGER